MHTSLKPFAGAAVFCTLVLLAACGGGGSGGGSDSTTLPYVDSILRGSYLHNGISVTIPEPAAVTLKKVRPAYTVIDISRNGNFVLLDLQIEMTDGVHPAQPYSARLAERIAEVLDRAAPECAS